MQKEAMPGTPESDRFVFRRYDGACGRPRVVA